MFPDLTSLTACSTFSSSCSPCSELHSMSLPRLSWSLSSSSTGTASGELVGVSGAWLGELPELGCPSPYLIIVSTYKSLVMSSSTLGALALVIKCSTCLRWAPQISLMAIWWLCLSSLFHALISAGGGLTFGEFGKPRGAARLHAL